jgi:hypothetical protein
MTETGIELIAMALEARTRRAIGEEPPSTFFVSTPHNHTLNFLMQIALIACVSAL